MLFRSNSVFGGYAVNLILPRAGEFWRCNFISKRFNQPFATVLGTIFSERIVDLIMLILIASIAFISQSSFFMSFFDNNPTIAVYLITILRSPVFYIVMVLLVAAIIIFYHKTGNTRFTKKLKEIVNRIWFGIKTIKAMKHKWIFIFLTICIWLLYFVNFWVCMFAFEFSSHLNVFAALSIFVMGSLAVIVPVQGGMGAWHFMIITTMIFYGVGETQASTFALVDRMGVV